MTPEELKQIADHPQGTMAGAPVNKNPTSALGAGALGAASGLSLGVTGNMIPGIAERSEQAWQEHPLAYAAGYIPGSLALGAAKPIVSGLMKAGEAGMAKFGASKAGPVSEEVANAYAKYAKGGGPPSASLPSTVSDTPAWGKLLNMFSPAITQLPIRAGTALSNPPEPAAPMPVKQAGQPVSSNEPDTTPTPFSSISNFLAQAKDSNNPAVQAAATEAQQSNDPQDPDAARKLAMALQTTPAGRAVGNSDSNVHDDEA